MFKKSLAIIGCLFVMLGVVLAFFIYDYRQEAKAKIDTLFVDSSSKRIKFELDSDSAVYQEDLRDFLLFSGSENSTEELIEKEYLQAYKDKFILVQDLDIEGKLADDCMDINCFYIKIGFKNLAPLLWKGLMGIEDYRFFDHKGIDYLSIARAILVDLKAMKIVQGGSTLTQQLVKNLFLSSEKKFSRKFKEIIYASYIEEKLSKDDILVSYFNSVYWGSFQGVKLKGIAAAAIGYFEKSSRELSPFESIILVGMLKGPYFYSPIKYLDRLKKRTQVVFKRLEGLKLISKRDKWTDSQWKKWHKNFLMRNSKKGLKAFIRLRGDSHLTAFEEYTLNKSIERMTNKMSKSFKGRDIGIKIISKNLSNDLPSYSYYNKTQRDLAKAISSEAHQVASILKPIIYDYFFDIGLSPQKLISTKKLSLSLKSGKWSPKDSSKAKEEFVTLEYALRKSKNIPLVRLSQEVGFEKVEKFLGTYIENLKLPLEEYPAQLLGAIELSLREVLKVYEKFIDKRCFRPSENISTIKILSNAKESTLSRMANPIYKEMKIFGKTGTSNKAMNNWFVGFDSKEVFIIWVGQETDKKGDRLIASGATTSFRVYQDFILNRGKRVNELICK